MISIKSQSPEKLSTLEIKYNFIYVEDTLNMTSKISEPMILLANAGKSIYYSENYKIFSDGFKKQLNAAVNTGSIVEPAKLPQAKVKHSVFRDNDDVYISNHLGKTFYTFIESEKINWKINNTETKVILGYKCSKATAHIGNRNYIAWFTYDIPINDGPYKFKGLPGLILKINDEHQYINFELISITKINVPIEYKKGLIITKEQYLTKRKEYINDPSEGKLNTPEYRKRIEDNKKRYNNFLEN